MHTQTADLVFLPGWSFHASIFEMLTPHLQKHRLHFIDLPSLHFHDTHTRSEFVSALPTPSTLIGWSLGGLLAISMCASHPLKFNKLILLASSPKFVADENHPGINSHTANDFLLRASQDAEGLLADFHKLVCMPSHSTRAHLKSHAMNNAHTTLSQLKYLISADFRNEYAKLTLPILSIAGERDAVLPPTTSNNIIIAGAGHAFSFTHHDEVCRHILNFQDSSNE